MSRTTKEGERIDKWGQVVAQDSGYVSQSDSFLSQPRRSITSLFFGGGTSNPHNDSRYDSGDGSDWFRSKPGRQYDKNALIAAAQDIQREKGEEYGHEAEGNYSDDSGNRGAARIHSESPNASGMAMAKSTPLEERSGKMRGIAWNMQSWSVQKESGLELLVNVLFTGSLKDFQSKQPQWPASAEDLYAMLKSTCSTRNMHKNAASICDSMRKSKSIIPLYVEVIGSINTTPHVVGWRTSTSLDQTMVSGGKPVLYVSYPEHAHAQMQIPFVSDVRTNFDEEEIDLLTVIGGSRYEDMVRPGDGGLGHVVKGSFAHKIILRISNEAISGSLNMRNSTYVNWKKVTSYEEAGKIWLAGIPMSALEAAREMIHDATKEDMHTIVPISDFKITPTVLNDGTWNSLKNTKDSDLMDDESSKRLALGECRTIGIVFRLHGFW